MLFRVRVEDVVVDWPRPTPLIGAGRNLFPIHYYDHYEGEYVWEQLDSVLLYDWPLRSRDIVFHVVCVCVQYQ